MNKLDWNIIFNLLQSISIIIASIMAILGIDTWRKEAKWKRKFEIAEEVLSNFYDAQERLNKIRSPFSYNDEGKSRKRSENEKPEESTIYDMAYVLFERYEKEKEPFLKIYSQKYRFRSLFGIEKTKPFTDLNDLMHDIFFSAHKLGDYYWQRQGRVHMSDAEFQKHIKEMHEHEDKFWLRGDDKDTISKRMTQIVIDIEQICSEVLKK